MTEEPELVHIGPELGHSSACWLPAEAAGVGAPAEELREQVVREGRQGAAVAVAEAIAASPEVA